jgi:hypothetical protein
MEVSEQLHAPAALVLEKNPWYLSNRRLGGPQSLVTEKRKILFLRQESNLHSSSPYSVAVSHELSRLPMFGSMGLKGRAIAQAVGCWFPTAAARVRTRV